MAKNSTPQSSSEVLPSLGTGKIKSFLSPRRFSKNQLIVFAVAFALIGGFIIWRSFAAGGTPYNLTSTISDGSTLSGKVDWTVTVGPSPSRVDFYIDGVKDPVSATTSPYTYGGAGGMLDTTKLTNGQHILKETAVYSNSNWGATHTVTVNNSVAAPPPVSGNNKGGIGYFRLSDGGLSSNPTL